MFLITLIAIVQLHLNSQFRQQIVFNNAFCRVKNIPLTRIPDFELGFCNALMIAGAFGMLLDDKLPTQIALQIALLLLMCWGVAQYTLLVVKYTTVVTIPQIKQFNLQGITVSKWRKIPYAATVTTVILVHVYKLWQQL